MVGITLAFTLIPGLIALLKGAALLLYPLNQRRVDEIERELAGRRTGFQIPNP
jgi:GPH family glycoside/pentoside/hexuronide:cation symporter